jgi:hypothetical protein
MALSREDALSAYLERLTNWAVVQTRKLWRQVDPDNIAGSWAQVAPAVDAVHRVLVSAALDAVDDYMTIKAADAGWLYDVEWRHDRPDRPSLIHNGQSASRWFGSVVPLVLWRIGRGDSVDDAMLLGLNRLQRVMGTEASAVFRQVTLDRVA